MLTPSIRCSAEFFDGVCENGAGGEVPEEDGLRIPLGKADVQRHGNDVTLVTYGFARSRTLQAAEILSAEGIEVEVVDLHTLLPLDIDKVLDSVSRTRREIVAHNATSFAGPGAEIAAQINEKLFGELHEPVRRVGSRR